MTLPAALHEWLVKYHLGIGISADLLTFCGALILARDAFLHLKDLQARRIHEEFERTFPDLPREDYEATAARTGLRMALRGSVVLLIGFLLQICSRLAEG